MKAYWVISEVSEGLGGWMGIRGRLEGIMEGLRMVHTIRLSHSSQSYPSFLSFHPCQNSPISVSFHLESPSRTSLLPYIHSIILSCIVFPSLHGVHVAYELPLGYTHGVCLEGARLVYRILHRIYMSTIHAWHTLEGIVVYIGLGTYI